MYKLKKKLSLSNIINLIIFINSNQIYKIKFIKYIII